MYILNLYIRGFGKLKNFELTFNNKINIIEGNNEAGKSTIHNFIKAIFYGLEKTRGRASKTSIYNKYEPWDKGEYGGYIRIKKDNIIYRIERDFYKNTIDSLTLINENTSQKLSNPSDFMTSLLNNLSSSAFSNTISISQLKSSTDSSMTNELKDYIANMNNTGNETLNISKAIDFLKAKRKNFLSKYNENAQEKLNSNIKKIRTLENIVNNKNFEIIKDLEDSHSNSLKESSLLEVELKNSNENLLQYKKIISSSPFKDINELYEAKEIFADFYKQYIYIYEKKPNLFFHIFCFLFYFTSFISLIFAFYLFVSGENNFFTNLFNFNYDMSISVFILIFTFCLILGLSMNKLISNFKKNSNLLIQKLLPFVKNFSDESYVDQFSLEKINDTFIYYENIYKKTDQLNLNILVLEDKLKALKLNTNTSINQINSLNKDKWEIENLMEEISNLKDENIFLKRLIKDNELINKELLSIDLALDKINILSNTIKNSFGFYLNQNASKLLKSISLEHYNSISIDSDMNIFLHSKNRIVNLEQVSSGTKDQVYLSLRLASAKLLQDSKNLLPLLFDDSFVNYDDTRLLSALSFLDEHYDGQLILFTHLPNPGNCLNSKNKPYTLIRI